MCCDLKGVYASLCEIDSKDIRTIKEKKYDTQHGNIKNFEENSSQKVFNSKWQDLNDRQREYLRKYNYPETWLEFTENFGFKVVNDIKGFIASS